MKDKNINKLQKLYKKISIPKEFIFPEKHKVAIFGLGFTGAFAIKYFLEKGIKVDFISDNNIDLLNKWSNNKILAVAPEKLSEIDNCIVYIANRGATKDIEIQLNGLGIDCIPFCTAFFEIEKHHKGLGLNQIIEVYNYLDDEYSKNLYFLLLQSLVTFEKDILKKLVENNQYFAHPAFSCKVKDVFIDVGAYVGDTIERLFWESSGQVKKIYAFEPIKENIDALKKRIDRLCEEWNYPKENILTIQAVLGKENSKFTFYANDVSAGSSAMYQDNDNGIIVDQYKLDDFIHNEKITFIKADVEGDELNVLLGAERIITSSKPRIAISVYHKIDDIITLPLYIKSIVPEYKMALRKHSDSFAETVLYCWCED
jgi:FkbM family methyltransferase